MDGSSEERDRVRAAARDAERVLRRPASEPDAPSRTRRADELAAVAGGEADDERAALVDALALVERSSLGSDRAAERDTDVRAEVVDETVARALDRVARRDVDRAVAATPVIPELDPTRQEWSAEIERLAVDAAVEPEALVDLFAAEGLETPPVDRTAWGRWALAVDPATAAALVEALGGRWSAGGFAQLHRAATLERDRSSARTDDPPRVTGVGSVVAPDPRTGATRVQHLTSRVPTLLTRRGVLTDLRHTVTGAEPTTTVLLGPPGHGKSVAAAAVAEAVRATGLAVVFVIPSRDLRALVVGLERVLLRLGTPQETLTRAYRDDRAAHADTLWSLLDVPDRRWLLVLDGAGAEAVGHPAWTRPPRHGHVIVTSTHGSPSRWAPSRVVAMAGLGPEDGARLLLDRLRSGPEPVGPEAEREARELSRRLRGVPLALTRIGELVARSGGDLAAWARQVASHRGRDAVETVVALALDTLGPQRQRGRALLLLLSCFAPDEPLPVAVLDAEAVLALGDVERTGLLERTTGGGRDTVRMPEAIGVQVRAGATERELATWERRALALLQGRLDDLDPGVPQAAPVILALEPHVVHLVQRPRSATPDGGGLDALRLADTTAVALMRGGEQESATSLLALARSHVTDLPAEAPVALTVRLTEAWMVALAHGGDLRRADGLLADLAADTARVLDADDPLALATLDTLAWVRAERDDLEGGAALFRRVLEARTRLDGPDGVSTLGTRHRLAWVRAMQGHVEEAMHEFGAVLEARVAALGSDHFDVYSTTYRRHWSQSRVGRHAEALAGFDALLERVEAVVGPEHQLSLLVRSRCAWARMWDGRARDALAHYAVLVPDQQKILGTTHRRVLVNRHNVAALHLWLGRPAEAEAELVEVIAARRAIHGADHAFTLDSRELHAWAVLRLGRAEDAHRRLVAVLADRARVLGPTHESTLATRYRLLRVVMHRGLVAEAEQQARALLDDVARPDPSRPAYPSVPVVRGPLPADSQPGVLAAAVTHTLAICRALRGHPEEARDLLEGVLRSRVGVVGEDAPEVLLARDRLGWATALEDPEAGLRMLREVRDARVRVLGAEHPHTLTSEYRVAWALVVSGRTDEALEAYTLLAPRVTALVGELDPQALRVETGRAQTLRLLGRAEEALTLAEELYARQLEVQGSRAVDTLRAAEEVGRALAALGRRDEALARLREVLDARRRLLGEDHQDTLRVLGAVEELARR